MISIEDFEEALFQYVSNITDITDIVAERLFANYVPARIALPTLCIFYIDKIYVQTHDGYDDMINVRAQFNSYAPTKRQANELADAVKRHLAGRIYEHNGFTIGGILLFELDVFEESLKSYAVKSDIRFFARKIT